MLLNFTLMNIHIGKMIKNVIETKGLIKEVVAKKMLLQGPSLHKILGKKDISTDQLKRFCEVLDYNFFDAIARQIANDVTPAYIVLKKELKPVAVDETEGWRVKYFDTLEKYTALLEESKIQVIDFSKISMNETSTL